MADEQFYRYCEHCGGRFSTDSPFCPLCVRRWHPALPLSDRKTAKALLESIQDWRQADLISAESYEALREQLEAAFQVVEPGQQPANALQAPAAPPPDTTAARVMVPPREPGPGFGALLVERQADILLYLGAFLLGIAALLFVAYQGDAVSTAVRVPVLFAYTVAGIAGGILVRRWDRVREAGHVFLAFGALLVPLNFVLLYVDVLDDGDVPGDVVWLFASGFCTAFYGALASRGLGSFYRIPATIALLSAWGSLVSVFGIPAEWAGAWYMLLAAAIAVLAAPAHPRIVAAAYVLGAFALTYSYFALLGEHDWQLAWTHALATAAVAASCYRLRAGAGVFVVLPLGAMTIAAALWAIGAPAATFAYPFLASGAVALCLRGKAQEWPGFSERGAWWYAAVMPVAPVLLVEAEERGGWLGLGFFASAAMLAYIAWKNTSHGLSMVAPEENEEPEPTNWWERAFFAWASVAMALAGVAVWQEQIGVSQPHTGWVFAAVAMLPPLAISVRPDLRSDRVLAFALPVSTVSAVMALPMENQYLYAAIFLALPGLAWIGAAWPSQRWTSAVVGTVFLGASLVAVAAEYDLPDWLLALIYAGAGLLLFVGLGRWRVYPASSERAVSVQLLSWGLHATALVVAVGSLFAFENDRFETGRELWSLIVERGEYRVLIALVAVLSLMIAFDGLRLGWRLVLLPASAVGLVAGVLAIGLANPENVQWYTAPIGVYLLAIGLIIRRSAYFLHPHLQWHETAVIAAAAFIVLPQAEQSFEPGGAAWGGVLIAEGLVFLAVGFVLRARWLVPAGTLVLSGVAIRWMFQGDGNVPYWVTLGILGMLLLAGGMFVMVQAEWWSEVRSKARRWWQEDPDALPPTSQPGES